MALWKARSLSPEQKVQIVEEESEAKSLQTEESGSFLGLDDVSMSEVHSSVLSAPVSSSAFLFLLIFTVTHFVVNVLLYNNLSASFSFFPFPLILCVWEAILRFIHLSTFVYYLHIAFEFVTLHPQKFSFVILQLI